MTKGQVKILDEIYDVANFNEQAAELFNKIEQINVLIANKKNMVALLLKAKNAYIADLNAEIVQERSGVDLGALFADD